MNALDDDGSSRAGLIADELGLPESHWLVDAMDDALSSGDAIFLLNQCRKHIDFARRAREEA